MVDKTEVCIVTASLVQWHWGENGSQFGCIFLVLFLRRVCFKVC